MNGFRFQPTPASEAGFSPEGLAEIPAYLDTLVANGDYPGAVILLARGDRLVLAHATGYADHEAKIPLHPDTIFPLYSMSKPLTAVAMMLLHEDGVWDLDDPVARHVPEFEQIANVPGGVATRGPTLREVFTHTAGFALADMPRLIEVCRAARSLTELVTGYARLALAYEPGESWEYSMATDILAEIVERTTGERFDLFLARRVFEPLGMVDTGFALSPLQSRRLAQVHAIDADTGRLRRATPQEAPESIFPMGGTSFKSTALDYARFARMLLNRGRLGDALVMKPESVDLMLSNLLPETFLETPRTLLHYVLGPGHGHAMNGLVCLDPARAGRPVGKGTYEWGGAAGAFFWIDPENDLLFVGLLNRARRRTESRPPDVVAQDLVYRALRR